MKHAKRNGIIILVITIAVLAFILKDDFNTIIDTLKQANLLWLIVTIGLYIIYFIFDQLSLHNIVKQYNKEFKFQFSMYLGIITKFFNANKRIIFQNESKNWRNILKCNKITYISYKNVGAIIINLTLLYCKG